MKRRAVHSIALGGAVLAATSSVWGQATGLTKGQQWFIKNGLQVQGLAFSGDPFHLSTFQGMNYTAIDWAWDSNVTLQGSAPGSIPWGRWVRSQAEMPPYPSSGSLNETSYMSMLTHLSLSDEPNLNDRSSGGTFDQLVSWFNAAHANSTYNNVLLWVNNWMGQITEQNLSDFIGQAHPDMVGVDSYPYLEGSQPAGGSPTDWYRLFRITRQYAWATNTPLGNYRQTYHTSGDGRRSLSESELRLQTFTSLAFNAKMISDFTYNSGASSFFNNQSGGDNSPNALYTAAATMNQMARNLGPAMVRLKPIADSAPDHTTNIMFVRGKHTDSSTYNDVPAGWIQDPQSVAYTDWTYAVNDLYLNGGFPAGATNLGTKNGGLPGDIIISWFTPQHEWFDGDDYSNEKYLMVTNGLADMNGSAADCKQSINLIFGGTNSYPYTSIQALDPATGLVTSMPTTFVSSTKQSILLTLDGGTSILFKYPDGAPFVGTLPPDASWNNVNGNFSTAANWDINAVPSGNYFLHFGSTSGGNPTSTATFTGNITATAAFVHNGSTTLSLAGKTLTLGGTAGVDSLIVGMYSGETSTLTVSSGTLTVSANAGKYSQIGKASGATGTLNLNSSTWNNTPDLLIGKSGTGTLNVNAGATANLTNAYLGGSTSAAGGTGVMSISGGTVNISGTLKVWNSGAAAPGGTRVALNQTNSVLNVGSLDTSGNPSRIAWTGGTLGITNSTLNIDSTGPLGPSVSTLTNMTLNVTGTLAINSGGSLSAGGAISAGTIQLNSGGTLTNSATGFSSPGFTTFQQNGGTFTQNAFSSALVVAAAAGANYNMLAGSLNITDSNSGLRVGTTAGNGTFTQSAGSVTAPTVWLGYDLNKTGTYSLSGSGTISGSNTFVGGTSTLAAGTGILNISGGTMTSSGTFKLWNSGAVAPGGSRVNFSGGTLNVGTLDTSSHPERFNWTTGSLAITNSPLIVASTGPLGATVTLAAAKNLSVSSAVTIAGGASLTNSGGVLTLSTISNSGTLTQTAGTLNVTGNFNNNGSADINGVQSWSATSTFTNNSGTAIFRSDAGSSSSRKLAVAANSTGGMTFQSTQHLRAISVGPSGLAGITPGGSPTLVTGSLSIDPAGNLDLADHGALVDYSDSTPAATIRQYLINGRGGTGLGSQTWAGIGGITSSAAANADPTGLAVGYRDAQPPGFDIDPLTVFGGQTVDDTAILIRYTYCGDANLDGQVDRDDLNILSNSFGQTSGVDWLHGDFDYNGTCDRDDFNLLSNNFGTDPIPSASTSMEQFGSHFGAAYDAPGTTVAPEASTFVLTFVTSACALWRRRRRRPESAWLTCNLNW